jgi:hypothetical protein
MTRMTREFSLVLVGAGVLTAGYFAWPEQDFEKRAEEQARARVGGNGRTHHAGVYPIFFLHGTGGTYASNGTRSPAMAAVSSRGFGSTGGRMSGGS